MHHAIAFAIASEFCRKRPFARIFRSENEFLTISFAKPFAIASELTRSAQFAAFLWRFGGQNSLANSWGASEFAFAFAAVSLRPRCTQLRNRPWPISADDFKRDCFANSPASYRSFSDPPGPKCPGSVPENGGVRRSVPRVFPEPFGPRAPECPTSVPRVSPECSGHFFDTLGTLSGHFLDTPDPTGRARRVPA